MLQYPFAEAPQPGHLIDVAPHVKWLRMPLPFVLNHINLWVLEDGDEVTLIDTGIDNDVTRNLWRDIFKGPLAGKKVTRVICTHFHPDHMGLAGWFHREHGIPIHMTPKEYAAAKTWHEMPPEEFIELVMGMFVKGGVPRAVVEGYARERRENRPKVSLPPERIVEIDPAQPVQAANAAWKILIGEGHAPQLVALFNAAVPVLISSDQVLPQISPNVSVQTMEPDDDPLKRFLDGFAAFKALPENTLVLPSHRMPFVGLHERIDALIAHHQSRLEAAREVAAQPVTAMAVMAKLFPQKLDGHQAFFAMGETLAHLNYLIGRGEIARETDASGVHQYRLVRRSAAA